MEASLHIEQRLGSRRMPHSGSLLDVISLCHVLAFLDRHPPIYWEQAGKWLGSAGVHCDTFVLL
jgi:hypothetical protein